MATLMRITFVAIVASLAAGSAPGAEPLLRPGLYRVDVRLELPNVQTTAAMVLARCVTRAELETGRAFPILSANPLRGCDQVDYEVDGKTVHYRVVCPGPNRGRAVAVFDIKETAYQGRIRMDMGGKNMTMAEVQAAVRVGECP